MARRIGKIERGFQRATREHIPLQGWARRPNPDHASDPRVEVSVYLDPATDEWDGESLMLTLTDEGREDGLLFDGHAESYVIDGTARDWDSAIPDALQTDELSEDIDWFMEWGNLVFGENQMRSNPRYHGELVDYRTGDVVRYASRDERFDSNHATLDDEGQGLIEDDDGRTYYVSDSGVRNRDGRVYNSPYDYVLAVEGDGGDTPDLILHDNGWHDDGGLALTLV